MLRIFNDMYKRYFSEEEAINFTLLIIVGIIIMMTMGGVIAPLLCSLILSFILQGLVNSLVHMNLSYKVSVYLTYVIFLSVMLLIIFILHNLSIYV